MQTYTDRQRIDEIGGQVSGGATIVAANLDDLEKLELLSVAKNNPASIREEILRVDEWWGNLSEEQRQEYQAQKDGIRASISDTDSTALSPREQLLLSLFLAEEIWTTTPEDERNYLRVLFSLGDTDRSELMYEAEEPALCFSQGSLTVAITQYVADVGAFLKTLGFFAIAIVAPGFVLPSVQHDALVEELREKAKEQAAFRDLLRLDRLTPNEINNKKGIIILLHGLFSTDVGTFDGFIKLWEEQEFPLDDLLKSEFKKHCLKAVRNVDDCLIVGWSHDTLTNIERNAQDLSELILDKLGEECPPIVFVCHSRGGLVARKTTVMMQQKGGLWADKIKLCVTFGTPHRGAALAESSFKFIAAVAAMGNASKSFLSVVRVLACWKHEKSFAGIEDLRPDSKFFQNLCREEKCPSDPHSLILPVGGIFQSQQTDLKKLWKSLMTGMLGTPEHDLIVSLKSTNPERSFPKGEETDCNHFEYFEQSRYSQAEQPPFKRVFEQICKTLKIQAVKTVSIPNCTPNNKSDSSNTSVEDGCIYINGLPLSKRKKNY